jgi:hypothetical protein
MIESWILTKIEPLRNEPFIILRDPQRMLKPGDFVVDGWAEEHGFFVPFCSGNMALREMVEFARADSSLRYLVVDRSRADARIPLFYPDMDALTKPRAHVRLSLRDFLVESTGDPNWPQQVNDRKESRLILANLKDVLRAHEQLRQVHPTRFTDSDCYKILLGGALKINPFRSLSTTKIRHLCIEQHDAIEELKSVLPDDVMDALQDMIKRAEAPFCWLLERDPKLIVRTFTLAALLHQHDLDYQLLLPSLDPALHEYRLINQEFLDQAMRDQLAADPDVVCEDIEDVEDFILSDPARLALLLDERISILEPGRAYQVLGKERLSPLVRAMALVSLLCDLIERRDVVFHAGVEALLDNQSAETSFPALSRPTEQWETLLNTYRRAIEVYRLTTKLGENVRSMTLTACGTGKG